MEAVSYRFRQYEKRSPENTWTEECTTVLEPGETIADNAIALIERFNQRESDDQYKRVFVRARIIPLKNRKHYWKKFSAVTQKGVFDIYQCEYCKAKGKRYGLTSYVTPDDKVGEFCKLKK